MRFQRRYLGAGFLAVALATGLYSQQLAHSMPERKAVEETRVRIVDQVEPFCRSLLPDQSGLRFVAQPQSGYSKSGWPRQMWLVDCLDEQNKDLVHILWDDDTQCVVIMSRVQPIDSSHALPICDAQAVELARKWVTQLSLATDREAQQSVYKLRRLNGFLNVQLYSPSGTIMVWLNNAGDITNTHANSRSHFSSEPVIASEEEQPPHA